MILVHDIATACASRRAYELGAISSFRASGGRVVGLTCHAFPPAVIAGLGLRPLRLLCGATADAERAGERVVRPDVCPLVKTLLGNVATRNGLHAEVDLWVGMSTCDQMRRGFHKLAEDIGADIIPIQLPATRTPEAVVYYVEQVGRMVAALEKRFETRFNPDLASSWQHARMRAAAVLADAALSGRVAPLTLHAMFHLYHVAEPRGLAELFDALLLTTEPYRAKGTIVLTGSPIAAEDTPLLTELERRGYAVIPLNCTGLNAVEYDRGFSATDLIATLAEQAFHLPACMRSRPNTAVFERIGRVLAQTRASGLIVKTLKFCDNWYTERERLKKTFDLPVLVFDSDYAAGGWERTLSRIEAFLETME